MRPEKPLHMARVAQLLQYSITMPDGCLKARAIQFQHNTIQAKTYNIAKANVLTTAWDFLSNVIKTNIKKSEGYTLDFLT